MAKPIVVFEGESHDPQWRLRLQTVLLPGAVTTTLQAISPGSPGKRPDDPAQRLGLPATEGQTLTRRGRAMHDAIEELVCAFEAAKKTPLQTMILHAAHRLQAYARKVTSQSQEIEESRQINPSDQAYQAVDNLDRNSRQPRVAASQLEACTDFCKQVTAQATAHCLATLDSEAAKEVLDTLTSIVHFFRDLSQTLPDITDKIATKPSTNGRRSHQHLEARLTQLVEDGLRLLCNGTPVVQLQQFLAAFIHATHCFDSSDLFDRNQKLGALVDRVVLRLRTLKIGDDSPLLYLFDQLLERVVRRDEIASRAALSALLLNDKFNQYLDQLTEPVNGIALVRALKDLLGQNDPVLWQAAARWLARSRFAVFSTVTADSHCID